MKCPVCSSAESFIYTTVSGYDIAQCQFCSLLFTIASHNAVQHVNTLTYGNEYIQSMSARALRLDSRFRMLTKMIQSYATGNTLVDVGCGSGIFLRYAHQHFSSRWSLTGVEPNSILRKAASIISKEKIVKGALGSLPFAQNSLDVVTCLDVLEHDTHLNRNVEKLKRVLKPGGILVIQAPNYKSLMAKLTGARWDWWSPPDHVLHFEPKYLKGYLLKHGLNIRAMHTYEDPVDFLSNIRGVWARSRSTKFIFLIVTPFLLFVERIAWIFGYGGLLVLVAQKEPHN